jgi:hypothetical protein
MTRSELLPSFYRARLWQRAYAAFVGRTAPIVIELLFKPGAEAPIVIRPEAAVALIIAKLRPW